MPLVYSDEKQKYVVVCYCGAKEPMRWFSSTSYDEKGQRIEWCEACSNSSAHGLPDVYWDGKPETNLVDERGNPMTFVSKGHKARWLKEKGLHEAGDRFHGGTAFDGVFEKRTPDRQAIRAEVHEAVQRVKAMSSGEKRAAMNKILEARRKQGRQHA